MNNAGVTRDDMMRVLPSVLGNDEGMNPLAEMIARNMSFAWVKTDLPTLYAVINHLPEDLLDILAKDFKVDWYDYNYDLQTKRNVIRDNFFVHRHLGTKQGIVTAVCDVWEDSLIEEWFQYDGSPYMFRVILNANHSDEDHPINVDTALDKVRIYKSARSHMESEIPIIRVAFGIVINTDSQSRKYHTPVSGTLPRWSSHGSMSREGITVQTDSRDHKYHVRRLSGDDRTGEQPRWSKHMNIDHEGVDVQNDLTQIPYHTPVAGQEKTGTNPGWSQHGNRGSDGLSVEASASGTAYRVKPCGTSRNSLM